MSSWGLSGIVALFVASFIAGAMAMGVWMARAPDPPLSLEQACQGQVAYLVRNGAVEEHNIDTTVASCMVFVEGMVP